MKDDRRLIEDYLPIKAISRENTTGKGHVNTLHLWWARRPLVACRAVVYGALVPADQFRPKNGPEEKRKSLTRANAAKFVTALCRHPAEEHFVAEAQRHILDAHAARLTAELEEGRKAGTVPRWVDEFKFGGNKVSREDIEAGRAPRPRVLDMFAGGGAIPLEALRLGCEAYALDLNPVAHIIELCTLVYPQKYGKPDPKARGMTGPKNAKGETTWGGLADEVRYWGEWVLKKVKAEIGDLYPPIPDPHAAKVRKKLTTPQLEMGGTGFDPDGQQELHVDTPVGYLTPVAYLWARTVTCKNPSCKATVPLVRQTWLCKRPGRYVAMRMVAPKGKERVRFEIVEAENEDDFDFDPSSFSRGGNATCPFCGTVADSDYTKEIGSTRGFGVQPMAIMCVRPGRSGKVYVPFDNADLLGKDVARRLHEISKRSSLTPPTEPLEANPRSFDVQRYGFTRWDMVFTARQDLMHLTVSEQLRESRSKMISVVADQSRADALYTCVSLSFSRLVTQHNAFCGVHSGRETIEGPWGDAKFPMSWDFAEANPFSGVTASYQSALDWASSAYDTLGTLTNPANVIRGSATSLPFPDQTFDAVITDPPYYDNVSYSNLSDAFYVWLKRSLGELHAAHFASPLTPKKAEAIMATYRHDGDNQAASRRYEDLMAQSLRQAHRVLTPSGTIAIVYAHKTTLGWSTLVDALRSAGFTIAEAWPLDTEARGGRKKVDKAMLASSIFLVARKRDADAGVGSYEEYVRPELERIVRERVDTLWDMGVSGADLLIACVGAGLRAFTRYERVEFANGEEVPAERFLMEVEAVVLDTILARLSKQVASGGGQHNLAGVDAATRFYVLWRYTYRMAELDAGEAIVFANGTHVELDGPHGLSTGPRPLVEKKKAKCRLRDYTERGEDEKLGLPDADGQSAPLVDVLQRILYLMENSPRQLTKFLEDARPNLEQIRLVAQALAGPALSGGELGDVSPTGELGALKTLTANWRQIVGDLTLFDRPKDTLY